MPLLSPHAVDPDFDAEDFHRDPYRYYEAYRRDAPVFRNREGVVYLTRYPDCELLLTDKCFRRHPPGGGGLNPFERWQHEPNALDVMIGHWLIFMDPPRHDLVRQAFSAPFSAKAVAALAPAIRGVARRLFESWRGRESVEFVGAFASPFPILVVGEMLGLPAEDSPRFEAWSSQMMRAMDSGSPDEMRTAIPASVEIRDYFTDLLRSRTAHPRDDLLGGLIAAARANKLTDDELIFGIAFLLLAGHETTKNLLASGMLALARHPDAARQLREYPDWIASAVEEMLRFESPFQKFSRWAGAPASFGEYGVAEGTLVTALIGAANRDPAIFGDAQRFDVRRIPNRHLAFSKGIHACLGTALARLEGRVAFSELLVALPHITVSDYRWRLKSAFRALDRLTLSLHGA